MKANIIDLIMMDMNEFYTETEGKLKITRPDYVQAINRYENLISELDKRVGFEIDRAITDVETITKDFYFDEGFRLAVKMFMGCVDK